MDGHQANGAFVAAGPPGFTALALVNLGARAQEMFASLFFIAFIFRATNCHHLLSLKFASAWIDLTKRRRDNLRLECPISIDAIRARNIPVRSRRASVLVQAP